MKRLINILLIMLLCLGITGCSTNENKNIKEENPGYEVITKYGIDIYNMEGYEIPVALGFPKIDKDTANSLYEAELQKYVTNYADLLMYLEDKNFTEEDNLAEMYVNFVARLYDEAGLISVLHTDGIDKLIYVKKDDIYYPLDIDNQVKANKTWMEGYDIETLCSDNKTDLSENIKKSYPFKDEKDIYVVKVNLCIAQNDYNLIYSEQGVPYKSSVCNNVEMIEWDGSYVPVGFGFPEYSHDEIRQMVDDPDKSQVANKIHTVADALSYYTTARFVLDEGNSQRVGDANVLDVGNVIYDDTPFAWYGISGLEQLSLKRGQCSGASTLFNYLLWGDYDDLGYVTIPGHCFMYIKGHDDKYYLFDPSDYIYFQSSGNGYIRQYMPHYGANKLCADSLEELMGYLVDAKYLGNTTSIFTLSYYGVMAYQMDTSQDVFDPMCKRLFPAGSVAECWLGDIDFDYIEFEHSTSQETILGVK